MNKKRFELSMAVTAESARQCSEENRDAIDAQRLIDMVADRIIIAAKQGDTQVFFEWQDDGNAIVLFNALNVIANNGFSLNMNFGKENRILVQIYW